MKIFIVTFVVFVSLQALLTFEKHTPREKIFIPPTKNILNFTFGYNDFLSSLMWVRVVQDFHICDQSSRNVKYPELKNTVDPLKEIIERELPTSRCENGWVFQMLDVISELSPDFRTVYTDGGTMLSVLVDDRLGARTIFEKGRLQFPKDWEILYKSAYHELFEMQNPKLAEELMRKAGDNGAPRWVYSLSAKLLTRMGRAQMAKTILEDVLNRDRSGAFSDRIKSQLKRVNEVLRGGK